MSKQYRLIFWFLFLLTGYASAYQGGNDTFGYMWTSSRGGSVSDTVSYDWINAKDGTVLISGSFDNEIISFAIPSDFNYEFYGHKKDSIWVSANGFITFSDPGSGTFVLDQPIPSTGVPDSMIAAFWIDLQSANLGDGIYYKIVGSAPNRKLVIEWDYVDGGVFPDELNCEIVLYENSGLIKLQYNSIDANLSNGQNATVGIEADGSDGIEYTHNAGQDTLYVHSAILFHNKTLGSGGQGSITPTAATAGDYENLSYTINNLPSSPSGLGKADHFSILNPFTGTTPTVTAVTINGAAEGAYLKNSQSKPPNPGYSTWYYDGATDSILVRTSHFDVVNSLQINFGQTMPGSPTNGDYTSRYEAVLDSSSYQNTTGGTGGWNVNVTGAAATVTHYTFEPAVDSTLTAGDSIRYTITARRYSGAPVDNSDTINLTTPGSDTAWFTNNVTTRNFGGGNNVTVAVYDTSSGHFTVKAVHSTNSGVTGESGLITVVPAAAHHFSITTSSTDTMVVGSERLLQVYLYDQYNNQHSDSSITFTRFQGSGLFSNQTNTTNDNTDGAGLAEALYTASTDASVGTDRIEVAFGTVLDTIDIPLKAGSLAELRIQVDPAADARSLGDTTITADRFFDMFAVGYDAYGNYKGRISSNWSGSGVVTELTPANPTDSIYFDAGQSGSGSVEAVRDGGTLSANSGLITVNPGPVTSVIIRTAPNGEGVPIDDTTLTVGQTLYLYSGGYDADNNYNSDVAVDWNLTSSDYGGLGPNTNTSQTTLQPDAEGTGSVATSSLYSDDATGTITAQAGDTSYVKIEIAAGGNAAELVDITRSAGSTVTFYAAAYDANNIWLGAPNVNWSLDPANGVGSFSNSSPATQNNFTFELVGSSKIRIQTGSGSYSDYSGIVTTTAGAPSAITQNPVDTTSAGVGQEVNDSLWIKVTDSYGNVVPGEAVSWSTSTDGTLSPANNQTDATGAARSKWKLRSTSGLDFAYADVAGLPQVTFYANALSSSADSIKYISGSGQQGTANTDVDNALIVQVVDSLDNGVPGISVTFSISGSGDLPEGGGDYLIYTPSTTTNVQGFAETDFKLGSKAGDYIVKAHNSQFLGSPVSFTLTAIPGAADSIIVYAGDQQTGTVQTQLANQVIVQVVDAYENAVSAAPIGWNPAGDGSVNNADSQTNASGYASANWILQSSAGSDNLTVTSGALSAQFTATANSDAASTVLVYSGNNSTTVAGSNQVVEASVVDQHGNSVEGTEVTFGPAGSVSIRTAFSDSSGVARSVYTAPANLDSSFAKAYIVGLADTAKFKIYAVRYIAGSLDPDATMQGQAETFVAQVNNPGVNTISLDQAYTTFSFDDGTRTFSSSLTSQVDLNPGQATQLEFASQTVDGDFTSGNYTPQIKLQGTGDFAGTLQTGSEELALAPLQILKVEVQEPVDKRVPKGGTVSKIYMQVRNRSNYAVTVDSVNVPFAPSAGISAVSDAGNPVSIAADSYAGFYFSAQVSEVATEGNITVDGYIDGSINGAAVYDHDSDQTDQFDVVAGTVLAYMANSLAPDTISQGQTASFGLDISASGSFDTPLNSDSTKLEFGGTIFTLDGSYTLHANTTTALNFTSQVVNLSPSSYNGSLYIHGTQSGAAFYDTLDTGSLLVQSPALLVINSVVAVADTMSQASDTLVAVYITNTGQAGLEVQNISVTPYGATTEIVQSLPFLVSGGTQQQFDASVTVPSDATTGDIILNAMADGVDVNSADPVSDSGAGITDSWHVAAKPVVSVDSIRSDYVSVSPGQSGIEVRISLSNTGDTPVQINSVTLLEQIGLYDYYPATYPVDLGANSQITISHTLDVKNNTATGSDTLYAKVDYTNKYSGDASNFTGAEYLAWKIIPSGGVVNIVSVKTDHDKVSQEQDSVIVEVRIKNETQNDVQIDSLALVFSNGADNYFQNISSGTPLGTLTSGNEQTYNLYVAVDTAAQTGPDTMHAWVQAIEPGNDTSDVADPTINDSWIVQQRPDVIIDSVRVSPTVASTGQNGLLGSVYLQNAPGAHRADAQIDSIKLKMFLGGADSSAQFIIALQSSPSLGAVLQAGQFIRYDFNVAVHDTTFSGTYSARSEVKQHDMNDGQDSTVIIAGSPGNLTVQQAALLAIDSVFVEPDTVSQGQTHSRVRVAYQNTGEAQVEINSHNLTFNPALEFNELLQEKTTPFTINGGQSDTLNYSIVIPTGFTGNVDVTSSISGKDLNSNSSISDEKTQIDAMLIQTPADADWDPGSTNPVSVTEPAFIQFEMDLTNAGQARVDLLRENDTRLELDGTTISIPVDLSSSNSVQASPALTHLVFENTYIDGIAEKTYPLTLKLRGISNGASHTESFNVGEFSFGSGLVSINALDMPNGNVVNQGDTSIVVTMTIYNSGVALPIDNNIEETTLLLRHIPTDQSTKETYVTDLQRTDTLTILKSNTSHLLRFKFNIVNTYPLDDTEIRGVISLDGGTVVDTSTVITIMTVNSIGVPDYVENSNQPDEVVPGESVSFSADFVNTGTGDITLLPDSTYMTIGNSGMTPVYLAGRYALKGRDSETQELYPTRITFKAAQIPETISLGDHMLSWHLRGELPTGAETSWDFVSADTVKVLSPADLVFSDVIIDSSTVRRGQENIAITYRVNNNGQSAASLNGFNFIFTNIEPPASQDVSEEWALTNSIFSTDTIAAGATSDYALKFNLSSNATTGRVMPEPVVNFNDIRTPDIQNNSSQVISGDTVLVIDPAAIRIDSLVAEALPNYPNVNKNQEINLRIYISNTAGAGADTIKNAVIDLSANDIADTTITITEIAANSQVNSLITCSRSQTGQVIYKTKILSATSKPGNVAIEQAIDDSEVLTVQEAANLSLSAAITLPVGAQDRVVSKNKKFTVRADVSNSGQAGYTSGQIELIKKPDYLLADTSLVKPFDISKPFGQWLLRATQTTATALDTMIFEIKTLPNDVNTGGAANYTDRQAMLIFRVEEAGNVVVTSFELTEPAGKTSDTLSTRQAFTLRSVYAFTSLEETAVAQINLPQGYSVQGASIDTLNSTAAADSNFWNIIAPAEVRAKGEPINVTISALDKNSGEAVNKISSDLTYEVEEGSRLHLTLRIIEPPGARDNHLSENQAFKLEAKVNHDAQTAPVSGGGQLSILGLGAIGFETIDTLGVSGSEQKAFTAAGHAVHWWIRAGSGSAKKSQQSAAGKSGSFAKPGPELMPLEQPNDAKALAAYFNELASITDTGEKIYSVRVDNRPKDVNTGQDAFIANLQQSDTVIVENMAEIANVDATFQGTVSTGQTFNYSIDMTYSGKLVNPVAKITLPFGVGGAQDSFFLALDENGEGRTLLNVPTAYDGPPKAPVKLLIYGTDFNSGRQVTSSRTDTLHIQRRATLSLIRVSLSPQSVDSSGVASLGQLISVKVKSGYASNPGGLPYAGISGSGSISLDASILEKGFTNQDALTKTFSNIGDELQWEIKTPDTTEITVNINFNFTLLPKDQNDGQNVAVSIDSGAINIPVRVREKTITITLSDELPVNRQIDQVSGNDTLIVFDVSNKLYAESLYVDTLSLSFYGGVDDISPASRLNKRTILNMIKTIRVTELGGATYSEYTLSEADNVPLIVPFEDPGSLQEPGEDRTFVVTAEFHSNAVSRSFRTVLEDVWAWNTNSTTRLTIVDKNGDNIKNNPAFATEAFTLAMQSGEEAFFNYPNPFGRQYKETNIQFSLDETADVEVRIFTLLGELVWTWSETNVSAGVHDNKVRWDGKNDRGHTVLNGVYLCAIDIKPQSGANKRYMIKIAYIK